MSTDHGTNVEVWRLIPGFPRYEVSNVGRVRNGKTKVIRAGKASKAHGYVQINLSDGKVRKTVGVHRLVAAAFLGGLMEGAVVNHKDKCRSNNRVDNLEIVTVAENLRHSHVFEMIRAAVRKELEVFLKVICGVDHHPRQEVARETIPFISPEAPQVEAGPHSGCEKIHLPGRL